MNNIGSQELFARITLHALPKIGSKRFLQLLNYFGSADEALKKQGHWQQAGLPSSCQSVDVGLVKKHVDNTLHWLEADNQQLLCSDSDLYPALLREIDDFPPLLFLKGNSLLLEQPQLAMVGSRHGSKPGLDTAFQFAKSLASAGFVITSGLALGIDGAAHQGALAGNGRTIAVLGCGLSHMYPASHHALAMQIVEQQGLLVSEFPLHTAPQAANFPRRNRIISGLSLGVLVVEASLSSGSLITAKLAVEQGREVMAIPGSIHFPGAKGCHHLIREGATLVESIEHILEVLQGWKNIAELLPEVATKPTSMDTHPIVIALQAAPQSSESLAHQLNMAYDSLLVELMTLELDGRICCEAGVWYAL